MQSGNGLGPIGTNTITPRMTWLNEPYGDNDGLQATPDLTHSIVSDILKPQPSEQAVIGKIIPEVVALKVEADPALEPTDPTPWIPSPIGSGPEAALFKLVITANGWPALYTPAPSPRFGPEEITKAGALVTYRAPNEAQVRAAINNPTGTIVNSASIINEIQGTNPNHPWNSLWTGDAHDTQLSGAAIRKAIMAPTQKKHYTVMKVGHHGSQLSNSRGFFEDVTADHYLISCDGGSGNPRMECIQWILDGHAKMRVANPTRDPPNIWISNLLDKGFTFDYKNGHVYQRNQSTNGKDFSRKGPFGSLYFQIVNGVMVTTPMVIAVSVPSTNYNERSHRTDVSQQGPSTLPAYRNAVVEFTAQRGANKRATIPNPFSDTWAAIFPDDRTQLLPDEITDLDANAAGAFFYRLVCSQSYGTWAGSPAKQTTTFTSAFHTLAAAPTNPLPLLWIKADYNSAKPSIAALSCGTRGSPPTVPDAPNQGNAKVQAQSVVMQDGEYVNAVDVYTYGNTWPTGFVFWTNEGRKLSVGFWGSGSVLREKLRPEDEGFGMVGWRNYVYGGDYIMGMVGAQTVVPRLGVVWMPMDE
jgi:hypothetical protein